MNISDTLKDRLDHVFKEIERNLVLEFILLDGISLDMIQEKLKIYHNKKKSDVFKSAHYAIQSIAREEFENDKFLFENPEIVKKDERYFILFNLCRDKKIDKYILGIYCAAGQVERFNYEFHDILKQNSNYYTELVEHDTYNENHLVKYEYINNCLDYFWDQINDNISSAIESNYGLDWEDLSQVIMDDVFSSGFFDLYDKLEKAIDENIEDINRKQQNKKEQSKEIQDNYQKVLLALAQNKETLFKIIDEEILPKYNEETQSRVHEEMSNGYTKKLTKKKTGK